MHQPCTYDESTPAVAEAEPLAQPGGAEPSGLSVRKPRSPGKPTRHGLCAAALPPGASWIRRTVAQFRRELERATLAAKREICITDACAIDTACNWQKVALLAGRWLRQSADSMDHATRLAYATSVAKASAERDKCVRSLGLAVSAQDELRRLWYGQRCAAGEDAA